MRLATLKQEINRSDYGLMVVLLVMLLVVLLLAGVESYLIVTSRLFIEKNLLKRQLFV